MMKVGVCGLGPMGRMHTKLLKQNDAAELVGVADVQEELRAQVGEELGVATYETAESMIDAGIADVIWVCAPTYLHAPLTIQALESGHHVFCEKPMALSGDECAAMIAASEKAGKMLTVGQVLRFWPEYVFLRNAINSGQYGKLQTLSMVRIGNVTIGWKEWFLDEKLGGTQIFDRHIHDSDMALWLLGKPTGVTTYGALGERGGYIHCFTRYLYPDVIVSAEGSADQPDGYPFTMGYHATFENGSIQYASGSSPTLTVYEPDNKQSSPELPNPLGDLNVGLNISSAGAYHLEGVYFLDCIANGRQPEIVNPCSAQDTVRLVRAEMESARNDGQVVTFA